MREEARRRKSFRLHQSKIDRAMAILGTRTETETIERALDMIAFRDMLVAGVRELRVPGDEDADWLNVFGGEDDRERPDGFRRLSPVTRPLSPAVLKRGSTCGSRSGMIEQSG